MAQVAIFSFLFGAVFGLRFKVFGASAADACDRRNRTADRPDPFLDLWSKASPALRSAQWPSTAAICSDHSRASPSWRRGRRACGSSAQDGPLITRCARWLNCHLRFFEKEADERYGGDSVQAFFRAVRLSVAYFASSSRSFPPPSLSLPIPNSPPSLEWSLQASACWRHRWARARRIGSTSCARRQSCAGC